MVEYESLVIDQFFRISHGFEDDDPDLQFIQPKMQHGVIEFAGQAQHPAFVALPVQILKRRRSGLFGTRQG